MPLKSLLVAAEHPFVSTTTGAPRRSEDAGLSLVEVMVAMAVFAIGSLSLLSVLTSSAGGTFDNRGRLTAANLAASDIDEARATEYYDLVPGTTTRTVRVDDRDYQVRRQVEITFASGTTSTSSCVASGSSRELHKRVSTSVSTDFRGGTKPATSDTILRAPVFDPRSGNGAIGFLVMDRSGRPLSGKPVAVPGKSRTTGTSGCAFLDGLAPGTYTVTVTDAGSVTRDGRTTLSKDVVVNKGQITTDSMRIHGGVSVTVRARAYSGTNVASGTWSVPNATTSGTTTNLQVYLSSPDKATSTAVTHRDSRALSASDMVWSGSVYPHPGGYEAWMGPCSSAVARFESEPSTSPVVDLPLSPVVMHLKAGSQDLPKSRSVTFTWVPPSGQPACTEVLSWPVTTAGDCHGQHSLTDARPCRLNLAVPPGTWSVRVSNVNGGVASGVSSTALSLTVAPSTAYSHVDLELN